MAGMNTQVDIGLEQRSRNMKHITRACYWCRKRKTKCDGARPRCANCVLYKQECVFTQEIDRRKVASKEKMSAVLAYVQDMESLLSQYHIGLPESRPCHLLPSAPAAGGPQVSPGVSGEHPEIPVEPAALGCAEPLVGEPPGTASIGGVPGPEHQDFGSVTCDALSDRMGSLQIAEDGQLRLFGPTSNLHISHVGAFPLFNSNIRSVYRNEGVILKAAGVDHHVEEELEDHLTKLYFTWENPNIPLVEEATYYREKSRQRKLHQCSHRYSEVLNNAICAVGAALTSRFCADLPDPLIDFFAARSKALLEVEMDSPTLSTVQSLGILSGVEALLTRDARGWLYSGMAMRLATDLGLHIDASPYAERGVMDFEEVRLRSYTFWGTYIHERMWSLYVGRPESIDHLDITVQSPDSGSYRPNGNRKWRPYMDENQLATPWERESYLGEVAQATTSLCTKMSSIRKILYNTPGARAPDLKKLHSFAVQARRELEVWRSQLPEVLAVNLLNLENIHPPHVLQLHMQFYAVLIIVDQPFAFLPATGDTLLAQDIQNSRKSCHEAAVSITKLIQAFRRHFTLRRINIQAVHLIFTAMLAHVHNAFFPVDQHIRDSSRRQLEICSQALGEIGQAYKNALRALEVITSIKSDLLRSENRARTGGFRLAGQPSSSSSSSMNGMNPLAQASPGLSIGGIGPSAPWPGLWSNEKTLNGEELMMGFDTGESALLPNHISLPDQWPWISITEQNIQEE